MIITRTSLRISFFGGGTDYPTYFRKHRGATLVTTINVYTYVTVNKLTEFFGHRIGVYYSQVERVRHIDEIEHPSVRECLRFFGIEDGIEIHIMTDLPARTGPRSSSSFTASLMKALYAFKGQTVSGERLAAGHFHRTGNDQRACGVSGSICELLRKTFASTIQ